MLYESKQHYEHLLNEYYQKYFDREPDKTGFQYYLELLLNGKLTENELRLIFLKSDEYRSFQQKTIAHKKLLLQNNNSYVYKGKFGILYNIDPLSMLDNVVESQGIWNEFLITILQNFLQKNSIIFDIGANVGLFTLPFAKILASSGMVYSFEPNMQIRLKLLNNIKLNVLKNVVIEEYALQNDPTISTQEFYVRHALQEDGRINYGISTLTKNPSHNINMEIVKIITLDNYIDKYNVNNIDLLKIDVEGTDFDVLIGGKKCIDMYKPIIVYEFSPILDNEINFKNTKLCFEFLKNKNYIQFRLNKNNLTELKSYDPSIDDSDIICFHKNNIPDVIIELSS
jgi:FkbM family methyltransferase